VNAEVVEPILVYIAIAERAKLLKLGTARVEWLRPASCRAVMDEVYTFPTKRKN
jgi:hypothetical protein